MRVGEIFFLPHIIFYKLLYVLDPVLSQETEEHGTKECGHWTQANSHLRSALLLPSWTFIENLILSLRLSIYKKYIITVLICEGY